MIVMLKRFLNYFTELETEEINKICNEEKDINKLKILLANEATKILHGSLPQRKLSKLLKKLLRKRIRFRSARNKIKIDMN